MRSALGNKNIKPKRMEESRSSTANSEPDSVKPYKWVAPIKTAVVGSSMLLAIALSGCGTKSESSSDAPAWDPCNAFPQSAMMELGYDYKSSTQSPGRECGWINTSTGYGPDISYLSNAAIQNGWRTKATSLIDITIGPYTGYQYRSDGVAPNFVCNIRLETKNSNVLFTIVNQNYGSEDPCPMAKHVATELAEYLPPPA
ncbi:DUF3558 family protein [Nocardia neocaledoniensis]|uniref:DUF3558 family protein n=1 Tax=Nocardia neocaledoniensis TaxID=236511 RepID=UPI003CC7CE6B